MEAEGQDLLAIDNEVTLSVTYINEYGKEVPTTVTKTFNSEANVTVTGTLSIADIEGRIENGKVLNGQSYNITEFVVDKEDYIPYGNITLEDALSKTSRPDELKRMIDYNPTPVE